MDCWETQMPSRRNLTKLLADVQCTMVWENCLSWKKKPRRVQKQDVNCQQHSAADAIMHICITFMYIYIYICKYNYIYISDDDQVWGWVYLAKIKANGSNLSEHLISMAFLCSLNIYLRTNRLAKPVQSRLTRVHDMFIAGRLPTGLCGVPISLAPEQFVQQVVACT